MSKTAYTQQDFGLSTDLGIIDKTLQVDGAFLIDAGCGNMHLSKELAQRGASVLGIDPDPIQAEKNKAQPITANVGFAQTGADAIPVESASVDGVLFPYSLHHIPADLYPAVFAEVSRVLKPEGFVYVIEPVAEGALNEVMCLFHNEREVRQAAQMALESLAMPCYEEASVITYRIPTRYNSWEEYASRYAAKSFNTNYTEEQVWDESVRQRFMEVGEPCGFNFENPMRVTCLRNKLS